MKANVNLKSNYVNKYETNNCNTHIAQYIEKYRQLEIEILSVNKI